MSFVFEILITIFLGAEGRMGYFAIKENNVKAPGTTVYFFLYITSTYRHKTWNQITKGKGLQTW